MKRFPTLNGDREDENIFQLHMRNASASAPNAKHLNNCHSGRFGLSLSLSLSLAPSLSLPLSLSLSALSGILQTLEIVIIIITISQGGARRPGWYKTKILFLSGPIHKIKLFPFLLHGCLWCRRSRTGKQTTTLDGSVRSGSISQAYRRN